jgi:coproporphyrinogen III oxidase
MDSEALRAYFYELQDNIVGTLGEIDGQPFRSVRWKREPGERWKAKA